MNKIILLLTTLSVSIYAADYHPWAAKNYPLAHIGECSKALLAAARDGDVEKVREHLDSGALIGTFCHESRETPLHLATWAGHKDVVQELLVRGADVLACNVNGNTPLHYAAIAGNSEMVTILARSTYDREPRNSNGRTPVDLAKERGYNDIAQCIDQIDLCIRRSQRLLNAALKGNTAKVRKFLNLGADIDARNSAGSTSLHLAAINGYIDVMRELVGYGILDVNAKNNIGDTPLHDAVRSGRSVISEIITFLLESGADTGAKNKEGKTPADLAQKYGLDDIVKLIRDYDDFMDTKTPLDV